VEGPSAKPFLSLFDRRCLARWLAEASGHGDFLEYHVRFNHPPSAIKTCSCGETDPEATSSSAPSPPLTILLLAAWTPEHFGTHINCSRIEKSQLEPSGLARDHPILIHILFFRLDPPLRVIGRAHDDGGQ
jgi:hypothetical protein